MEVMRLQLRAIPTSLINRFRSATSKINRSPTLILGNQKSGTSAIAHLLAEYGGLSRTVDIPEIWYPTLQRLVSGELGLLDFASRHKHRFTSELIKEPNLTFLYPQLKELHAEGSFVFVVRDPRDNVRSLLNRMNLPGDREAIDAIHHRIPEAWQIILDSKPWSLETETKHYIKILGARWNRAADVYLDHSNEMVLVRYEDFVADKEKTIEELAERLGLPQVNDISDKVDTQFQPRGDREISWEEFFGLDNLMRIERVCGTRMQKFGYTSSNKRTRLSG
jgi:hypothetical protein